MTEPRPPSGYVSWQDLERHSTGEQNARHEQASRFGLSLADVERRMTLRIDQVETNAARERAILATSGQETRRLVDAHDDLIQQFRGASAFIKFVLGTSLISAVLSIVALIRVMT